MYMYINRQRGRDLVRVCVCKYICIYFMYVYVCVCKIYLHLFSRIASSAYQKWPTWSRGGGLGSRPKKMYGERLGDGVEYHLMSPTPRC